MTEKIKDSSSNVEMLATKMRILVPVNQCIRVLISHAPSPKEEKIVIPCLLLLLLFTYPTK